MRGIARRSGVGRRVGQRSQAVVVAVAVLLAIGLVTGAMVLAQTINGGPTYDFLQGTPGDDVIQARDGGPDTIDCGAGTDTVYVDRAEDGVFDCEQVVTP